MKIGIMTLNSAHNFGASLQLYALQKTLENLGFETNIINYRYKKIDNIYNPHGASRRRRLDYKFYLRKIKSHIRNRYKIKRYENYENFFKEYFNLTKPYNNFKQLTKEKWDYDFYICGSDQIWNSHITRGLQPAYFLDFLPENSKKISYGASLGTDKINEYDKEIFKQYLDDFDFISLREKSSVKSLKACTEKKIEVVSDPTLLLKAHDYDKLRKKVPIIEKIRKKKEINEEKNEGEYIFVYIIDYNEELCKIAEKISSEKNLPIIFSSPYLKPKKEFKRQTGEVWDVGPGEFLELLANAKYVVTNSYHGNIFSILYEKKFISAPHHITSSRVTELLNYLDLNNVIYTSSNKFKSIDEIVIDYSSVQKKIDSLKNHSIEFLKESMRKTKKSAEKVNYLENNTKNFACYGCFLCKEICKQKAIDMIEDKEGFLYPKINENLCESCDMCKNNCIYYKKELLENKGDEYPFVYAAYNKNDTIRFKSSSGGIFLKLAKKAVDDGAYVVGVGYNSNMEAKYMIGKTLEEVKKFSGSKYVRANIQDIFPKVKELLENGEKVLFSGNACVLGGLKAYLNFNKTSMKNLNLVEILCHSNPSPKIFKKYIKHLEKKFNSKIIDFKFKNKTKGWNKPSVEILFENGEKIIEEWEKNNYTIAFQKNLMARPSCYTCEFIKEKRTGDISIGDFWGIERFEPKWSDDKGVSLVMINNEKGKILLEKIQNSLEITEKTLKEAFQKNHSWHILMHRKRNEFFSKLDNEDIDELLYSYKT